MSWSTPSSWSSLDLLLVLTMATSLLVPHAADAAAATAASAATATQDGAPVPFPSFPLNWTWARSPGVGVGAGVRPVIIGHRGASGMYPEHTRRAYEAAAEQGADYIECDVVLTKDLELVCSHEPWISGVTNVVDNSLGGPQHADFSSRRRSYRIDDDDPGFNWNDKGVKEGFFTFDFTLEELLTLRRKQPRDYRNPFYDWDQSFVSFREYLKLSREIGFGIYPEVKHGAEANRILASRRRGDVTMESLVVQQLKEFGYTDASQDCYVQSFELETFKLMRELGSKVNLVFLLGPGSLEKSTDDYLERYKSDYGVVGIGIDKDLIVEKGHDGRVKSVNADIIQRVHSHGLSAIAFTFRNEPRHLTWDYGQDPYVEYERYLNLGLDGYFTDFPASLRRFFEAKRAEHLLGNLQQDSSGTRSQVHLSTFAPLLLVMMNAFFSQ